jgi:predicted permease
MPEWKHEIRRRLAELKLEPTREAEIVEELAQHLEDRYSELRDGGATDEEARCAALAELSDSQLLTQELKRVEQQVVQEPVVLGARRINMIADLWQDLRYGLRMLRKSPAFTAIAVLTLALGIGANTALFSVADEVLLKSLPVRNPEQLVLLSWASGPRLMGGSFWPGVYSDPTTGASTSQSFSYLTFESFQAQSHALSDVFGFTAMFRMSGLDNDQDSPSGQMVSGNYYNALGVPPVLGRMIMPDDDKEVATPVTVISYRYWQREFGFDPAAVGKTIELGNTPFTIVGITPAGFAGAQELGVSPDFSIPLAMAIRVADVGPKFTDTMKKEPWLWTLMIMGRLKPGVSFDEVRADLQEVFQATAVEGWHADPYSKSAKQAPDTPRLEVATGSKGLTDARRSLSKVMIILMAVVGLVLLIVCSNLANLLLARAATRQKEIAVRLAVGAGRSRVIRQLLTESSLLALCGAGLGTLVAFWGKDLFLAWINRINSVICDSTAN